MHLKKKVVFLLCWIGQCISENVIIGFIFLALWSETVVLNIF